MSGHPPNTTGRHQQKATLPRVGNLRGAARAVGRLWPGYTPRASTFPRVHQDQHPIRHFFIGRPLLRFWIYKLFHCTLRTIASEPGRRCRIEPTPTAQAVGQGRRCPGYEAVRRRTSSADRRHCGIWVRQVPQPSCVPCSAPTLARSRLLWVTLVPFAGPWRSREPGISRAVPSAVTPG